MEPAADTAGSKVQGSIFEENYLLRTLGTIAHSPDVALTELVANAWDAGASRVAIIVPEELDGLLVVEDDGCGMTSEQFRQRWMTLAYDRVKHQGRDADFPPERASWRRPAYGRNGVGRHGLLCFASDYTVETWQGGKGHRFKVRASSGTNPFLLIDDDDFDREGHGTKLAARVTRSLPKVSAVRDVLSSRFLHDPQFLLLVNGESVALSKHIGLVDQRELEISDDTKVEVFFIDTTKAARTTLRQGVAFWVGQRLVGVPSWTLGKRTVIDGRTQLAKRHTVVAKSDLFEEVMPDWSSFRESEVVDRLMESVADYVEEKFRELGSDRIQEAKEAALREHRDELVKLRPLAKLEVAEFVEEMTARTTTIHTETLSLAVQAVIRMEQSRTGAALLEKLARLDDHDLAGLDRLLSEWTVRDALTVLDEIDRRLSVIAALEKISGDPSVDELHTLHPLVTHARWLFGPEFDSPEYTSNQSLRQAVAKVFGKRAAPDSFINASRRPDLIVLEDATLSAVATERIDGTSGLATLRDVLIVELKRGASEIGREEVHQASDYVEDLLNCGLLDGPPYIRAFVVGHRADPRVEPVRTVGDKPERGRIQVCSYAQLVRTAERRLFRLKERLKRYDDSAAGDLVSRVLKEHWQYPLDKPS